MAIIIIYMDKKFTFNYLFIAIIFYVSCIFHHNLYCNMNKFIYVQNDHQRLISKIFCYQIYGSIACMVNSQKIFGRFIWTQHNKYSYNVKCFDIFGFTLISIYVEDGIVSVASSIARRNNNFEYEIQKWFVTNQCFLEQLQQWIIGSPGYNTEYSLNAVGCLSYLHYYYNNESIFIYYRSYYVSRTPMLPKILEIYYGKHYVKLIINRWNIQ